MGSCVEHGASEAAYAVRPVRLRMLLSVDPLSLFLVGGCSSVNDRVLEHQRRPMRWRAITGKVLCCCRPKA
jgi:hypothetical protein